MRIDLKALLLMSTSAPDSVIRMNKRFQVGKGSFMIRYELRKGELIIRHMKKIRHGSTPTSQAKKRQRRPHRKMESRITTIESSSQTSLYQNSVAVSTEKLVLVATASQTSLRECSSIQTDTLDLFFTNSKDQQTTSCEIQASGSQTEEKVLLSRISQTKNSAKSWSTQTRIRNASLGSQTEIFCNNMGVQSKVDGKDETIQTDEVEEQLIRPYMQATMLESIKNMSNLISSEVISAVSQVIDIRGRGVKPKRQVQDLPREGALEPLTPVDQIGDKLSVTGIKGRLSTTTLKTRLIKVKKFSAGHSLNNTKCKHCSRIPLPIDSQSTQTEETVEEDKEQKMAKVSVEMATQTEKLERSRWTLKCI